MAEALAPALPEAVQEVVRQIAERFRPQQVILFGSYASGAPTYDSDVDLLVVMETEGNPLHTAADIAAAVDHLLPLDILVVKPSEWQASLERGSVFAAEVVASGVLAYEV